MMMRSAPPRSMNLALMPVPAPAAMIGSPRLSVARRRSTTSLRVYGFPFPVQGLGMMACNLAAEIRNLDDFAAAHRGFVGADADHCPVHGLINIRERRAAF